MKIAFIFEFFFLKKKSVLFNIKIQKGEKNYFKMNEDFSVYPKESEVLL